MKTLMFVLFACVTTASVKADERCEPDIPSRPLPTLPITDHSSRTFNVKCPEGEFSSLGKCLPCEAGTFRTKAMAALDYPTCLACQEVDTNLREVVMTSCNRTRDSRIMCENGYYRYETPEKPCLSQCKICSFCGLGTEMFRDKLVRNCSDTQDTLCCDKNYIPDELGRRCVEMTSARPTTSTRLTEVKSQAGSAIATTKEAPIIGLQSRFRQNEDTVKNCVVHSQSSVTLIILLLALACYYANPL